MSTSIPVETAANNLRDLLTQLPLGETMTLVDAGGTPLALLVSLHDSLVTETEPELEWERQWDALAHKISAAWQGNKSAVDTLIEMRR
jgi:hypothetical protein